MNELPDGFVIRLAEHVRVRDSGRTIIGGAPPRVSHLSEAARRIFPGDTLTVDGPASRLLAENLLASGIAAPVTETLDDIDLDDVTCVVPVRDRAKSLDRLLTSLAGLPHLVVVDDCSREPDSVAKTAAHHGAILISLEHNLGPAGARNAGLGVVTTPYVLFADADVVLTTNAVSRLLKHFHDSRVAVAAPRILGLGHGAGWLGPYEDACSSLDMGPQSALVRPRSSVAWLPSAVMVARVEALGQGFDESMTVGEDVDLIWRLTDSGWRIRYDADIIGRHDHRTSFGPWLKRKAFYGLSANLLATRHGRKVAPAVLTPVSAAIAIAALFQRRWSMPVIAILTGVTTARLSRTVGRSDQPRVLAAELTARGISATLAQTTALMLRHWWPLATFGAMLSTRIRRAVVLSAVLDSVIEYRRTSPDMDPLSFAVARRLDDLAYGTGVWAGAARGHSVRALLPDFQRVPLRCGHLPGQHVARFFPG